MWTPTQEGLCTQHDISSIVGKFTLVEVLGTGLVLIDEATETHGHDWQQLVGNCVVHY